MGNQVAFSLMEMIRLNRGDQKRIEHSVKVFGYAQLLGRLEGLTPEKQFVLELTAILHDIGIHVSEKMEETWIRHRINPSVRISLDLFEIGIFICKKGLQKEDFVVRF